MEEDVYRAIADPTRRALMDELFRRDGQTLGELEERFAMSRFGVMKHLKVLEEARLVVPRRRGREKLHFLNPVPIRLMYERWVSKFEGSWADTILRVKERAEREQREKEEAERQEAERVAAREKDEQRQREEEEERAKRQHELEEERERVEREKEEREKEKA